MVLLIIIPMKNGYFIGKINPTFSGPNPYPMTGHAVPKVPHGAQDAVQLWAWRAGEPKYFEGAETHVETRVWFVLRTRSGCVWK